MYINNNINKMEIHNNIKNNKHHFLSIKELLPSIIIKGRIISSINNYISNINNNNCPLLTNLKSTNDNPFTFTTLNLSSCEANCLLLTNKNESPKYIPHLIQNMLYYINVLSFPIYSFFIFSNNDNYNNCIYANTLLQCEIKSFYIDINFHMELITNENLSKVNLIVNINNPIQLVKLHSLQQLYQIIENKKDIIYENCYLYLKEKNFDLSVNNFYICVEIDNKFKVCYKIIPLINKEIIVMSNILVINAYFLVDDDTDMEIDLSKGTQFIEKLEWDLDEDGQLYLNNDKLNASQFMNCSFMSQNTTDYTNESLMGCGNIYMMMQKIKENQSMINSITDEVETIEKQIKDVVQKVKEQYL